MVTGEDPQFIVTFASEDDSVSAAGRIGGIELKFGEAWEGEEPLNPLPQASAGYGSAYHNIHRLLFIDERDFPVCPAKFAVKCPRDLIL
mgnify:CR=1 FL=1